jgi:hypothetical protein
LLSRIQGKDDREEDGRQAVAKLGFEGCVGGGGEVRHTPHRGNGQGQKGGEAEEEEGGDGALEAAERRRHHGEDDPLINCMVIKA